jgi:hypothetical protein
MANEKQIKTLETLIDSMKKASDELVKPYPGGSIAIKYMSKEIEIMVADLKGRDDLGGGAESQKRQVHRTNEQLQVPGVDRVFTTEEMNHLQQKIADGSR